MLKTVEGMYQDGQIQRSELPEEVSDRAQVLVTFLQPGSLDPAQLQQLIDHLKAIATDPTGQVRVLKSGCKQGCLLS